MVDRFLGFVADQILLADIGDVALLAILGEQVVEGLLLRRADLLGDRLVPFLAVRKLGVDVEDHPPEVEQSVPDDLADREARQRDGGGGSGVHLLGTFVVRHGYNLVPLAPATSG
jgi:hypothetical protein